MLNWGSSGPCPLRAHSPSQETDIKQVITSLIRVMKRNPQGASSFTWTSGSGKVSLGKGHLHSVFREESELKEVHKGTSRERTQHGDKLGLESAASPTR